MHVYLVHGWESGPDEPALKWLATSLETRDYEVSVPLMPHPEAPTIDAWVGRLARLVVPDEHAILVGHSVGCQAILRYLASLPPDRKVKGTILIAPWMTLDEKTMKKEGREARAIAKPWIETPLDFPAARAAGGKITAIFSDNDPYVPLENKDIFEKELGAHLVLEKHKGHFSGKDGVELLPSALNAVLAL